MIKYATGFRRIVRSKLFWGSFFLKSTWGALRNYPVFRVPHDHSVYAADNQRLPTTTFKRARLVHRVSCWEKQEKPAVIEFEHPFMLIGGVGEGLDYDKLRATMADKFRELVGWLDPQRYRLVATSTMAGERAVATLARYGMAAPDGIVRVLPWSSEVRRRSVPPMRGVLNVFHYGGLYPASKGTLDVLRVAALLPQVLFHVSVALDHPMLPKRLPANVKLFPLYSRRDYYSALRRSHVVLHPIYGDGWGIIIDALAHAMPVVLYDSYDKAEGIEDGVSGRVVSLPSSLSFYDNFLHGKFRTVSEFEQLIADSYDESRISRLAQALNQYAESEDLLRNHSTAAVARVVAKHEPDRRAKQLRALYDELLRAV